MIRSLVMATEIDWLNKDIISAIFSFFSMSGCHIQDHKESIRAWRFTPKFRAINNIFSLLLYDKTLFKLYKRKTIGRS